MGSTRRRNSRHWLIAAAVLWTLVTRAVADENAGKQGALVRGGMVQTSAASQVRAPHSGFVPADRTTLLLLGRAQELMRRDRYAEAVRCLGSILESPEDYFFQPDRSSPVHRSLKAQAQRLLGEMPSKGRELYELQYGAAARKMLDEAAAAGDADGLAEISRRFFHTAAGYEATFLLGMHHLDRGSSLAGALTLKRLEQSASRADQFEPALSLGLAACLARARMVREAGDVLAALRKRNPRGKADIGGQEIDLSADIGAVLDRLTALGDVSSDEISEQAGNWVMVRGNPARNASTSSSGPLLTLRWKVPTTDHPALESLIDRLRQEQQEQDVWLLCGLHPLVVDDVVLMRTASNLLAVDFKTGKRLWEVGADDPFEGMIDAPAQMQFRVQSQLEGALRQRLWGDAVFGTLSSDGRCVFSIEGLDLQASTSYRVPIVINGQGPAARQAANRLTAYHIHTGKLMWQVGGPADQFGLPLADTFFLGPPLPLMGNLYVLAEVKDEIRLLVLEAKTGTLLWSQQLSVVERNIASDPLRRMAGVWPSYADGILVCPTSNRSLVALELATRSLLWAYTYDSGFDSFQQQLMSMGVRHLDMDGSEGRWAEASVILAEGRVLSTPLESDELHCLDLASGDLVWKRKRESDFYVGCVHQGKVVVIGRNQVRALRLDDGSPAWDGRTASYPTGGVPSGTGFAGDDAYYVPLSNSQVAAVDLAEGRVKKVFLSRQQNVPGNLVCYKDKIISQRVDAVEAFHQLDALRKQSDTHLASRPDDPQALTQRGEIFWSEGKLDEAIDDFRRSLGALPAEQAAAELVTRQALRDALFEGLRVAFTTYRDDAEEIQRLVEDSSQQATLWRLMAAGSEESGDFRAAFNYLQKLLALDMDDPGMDVLDGGRSVRRDRWIQARLAAVYRSAPAETREEVDRWADAQLETLVRAAHPAALDRFLGYWEGHRVADQAAQELAGQWRTWGEWLRAELVLRRQEAKGDRAAAAWAVAKTAAMLGETGRTEDAAVYYGRLQREFADAVCLDGKTGRELVDALPASDPVRRSMRSEAAWPTGEVLVRRDTPKSLAPAPYGTTTVECLGGRAPFFLDLSIELQQSPAQLVARDGLGNERWHLALDDEARRDNLSIVHGLMRAQPCGHLLLVAMGQRLMAVDTLGRAGDRTPRVLWTQELSEPDLDAIRRERFRNQWANLPGAFGVFQSARLSGTPTNMPAAVSERFLCLRRFRTCTAIDPATGETLWVRNDVRPDSALFGDRELVFIVPAGQATATVVRAQDGEVVGTREVPRERLTTIGRLALVMRFAGRGFVLELLDPWERRATWSSRMFDQNAKLDLVDEEALAVLEPSGRFVLLNLADGRAIIDEALEPEPSLGEIFVKASPDQYVLVTHRLDREEDLGRRTYPIHGINSARIGRAKVYAFDRDGQKLWPSPVSMKNQYLPLDQPRRLPVLTFACMVQQHNPSTPVQPTTALLCLDKRTGRVLLNEEFSGPTSSLWLTGDPQKKTVTVRLQRTAVTLAFTDQPWKAVDSPAPPQQHTSALQALWKALRTTVVGRQADESEKVVPAVPRRPAPSLVPPELQAPIPPIKIENPPLSGDNRSQ